jgi:UDP-N-acetylglucosamine--N-acetylmuramyl-(pentapeptide) pyrophosphoryl-undecaprenol N-acetylglucosamine transferase
LIPAPNVTDNHQEKNARAMEEKGAAVVVLEAECTEQRLMEEIQALLADPRRYSDMGKALQNIVIPDCAERLCDVIQGLKR